MVNYSMSARLPSSLRSGALPLPEMVNGPLDASQEPPKVSVVSRAARRRAKTRAQLIDAARALFSRQGVDATRINEITEQADVGFGSFYNHFDSKDAIVEAVVRETIESQAVALERIARDLEDPAEVVAVAHRHFLSRALRDPEWGWLLIRIDVPHRVVTAALEPFAMRDLERGLKQGRFAVGDPKVALHATGGALLAVMRLMLDGDAPKDADIEHAEGVLRLLGLSTADAAEVARRPLPRIF